MPTALAIRDKTGAIEPPSRTPCGTLPGMDTRIPSADEIGDMTEVEYKVAETRARRMAQRQGYRLEKSRRRDPRAVDFGSYMLVDIDTGGVVAYGLTSGYGLSLTDVFEILTEDDA
jgi:hypothetical protein